MTAVLLYRQRHCAACAPVERYLREHGVAFTPREIDTDPAAMAEFLTYGYLTTPLTVIAGTPVAGFQPKRLAELLASRAAAAECTP
ncbi:MAG TPA: glutaredoxin family protein [Dehalococcoidia bacterium]|nr:glutaredoxin family protein [Dehalococcoidia bacterium]